MPSPDYTLSDTDSPPETPKGDLAGIALLHYLPLGLEQARLTAESLAKEISRRSIRAI